MRDAMESLSETHNSIKILLNDLEFPVSEWDENWINMYFDDSLKLLDICIALSSELSRLDQSQLLLKYVLYVMDCSGKFPSSKQIKRARAYLHDWMQQLHSRSPKFENCPAILQGLATTLCLAKVKNSAKGKVLMRAFYAVKVETIFVCSVIVAALSGCSEPLIDLHVSESFLWSEVFNDLQADVNEKVRGLLSSEKVVLSKELEAVDTCAKKLYVLSSGVDDLEDIVRHRDDDVNHEEAMTLEKTISQEERERWQKSVSDLADSAKKLADGIDLISEQSRDFFKIVLTGRDTLLCKLRESNVTQEDRVHKSRK
ncbi:protein BPS1, chloroplastic [Cocos nucifera]|uniref:Protein BPS1, chloroplastic n=1 Tax=Cocos nucifera TaxID=13894 RepID=A0A8K0N6D8_COCNU|nr:protein BPS1, chloroplastic [Cocos nucifera]